MVSISAAQVAAPKNKQVITPALRRNFFNQFISTPYQYIQSPVLPSYFSFSIQQKNHYCQPVYFHSQDSNYCVAKDSANELQPRHFDQNELHPPHRHGYPPNHPAERSCHKISDEKQLDIYSRPVDKVTGRPSCKACLTRASILLVSLLQTLDLEKYHHLAPL